MSFKILLTTLILMTTWTATAAEMTLDEVLASPSNPLHLKASLQTNSSSQLITTKTGGQILLTGLDGTKYTLTFPANSVPYDTTITMTETKETQINGVSFQSFGVQIYPDGMELIQPATLEIQTTRELQSKSLSIVTSKNDGSLAHIPALKVFKEKSLTLALFHFSNYAATDEEKIQEIIELGMADLENIRIINWLNQQLLKQKENSQNSDLETIYKKAIKDGIDKVVAPKLLHATTCTGGTDALSSFFYFTRVAALLSIDMDEIFKFDSNQAFVDAIALTKSLCLKEARQYCNADHNIPEAFRIWLVLNRFAGLLGDEKLSQAVEDAAQKCLKFKFFMETDFKMGEGKDIHGLVAVSEFDLNFTIGGTLVAASGFLNSNGITEPLHDFQNGTISIIDTYLNIDSLICTRTSMAATPGPIQVDNFVADLVAGRAPVLRLADPNPEVKAQFLCRDPDSSDSAFPFDLPPYGAEKYFLGIFHATHGPTGLNEMNKEGYFDLRNAVFQNSSKYAEAVYNHIVEDVIHETTTIVIHHTPED